MQVATGKSILNGIAIGPLRIYKKAEAQDQPDLYIDPGRGMGTLSSGLRQSQGTVVWPL